MPLHRSLPTVSSKYLKKINEMLKLKEGETIYGNLVFYTWNFFLLEESILQQLAFSL